MFQVGSPWILILPTLPVMGIASKMAYDAFALEDQSVYKFATSLFKTFQDQIPSACWKQRDDIQILNCFFKDQIPSACWKKRDAIQAFNCFWRESESASSFAQEESQRLVEDFQEYRDQYLQASEMKITALFLMILSVIIVYLPLPE